jgi:hypothetical protein
MKKKSFVFLMIVPALMAFGQQVPTMTMKPEMTEIWDPEIKIVNPGAVYGDVPSDAISLFNGKNLEEEWTKINPDGKLIMAL